MKAGAAPRGTVVLADEDDVDPDSARARGEPWARVGFAAFVVESRALGRRKPETATIAGAVDHNEAEWGVWVGRPLLGQWVFDLLQWLEVVASFLDRPPAGFPGSLRNTPRILHGRGAAGTAAILAAAYAPEVETTIAEAALVQFIAPEPIPWRLPRMGLIAPNLLKLGDVGRLASLAVPRRLVIVEGQGTDGEVLSRPALDAAFDHARSVYGLYSAADSLVLAMAREEVRWPPEA